MTNIIVWGCGGKMGGVVADLASRTEGFAVAAGIEKSKKIEKPFQIFKSAAECTVSADVLIDFSHPSLLDEVLAFCTARKLPAVIGTTGIDGSGLQKMKEASAQIPIFYSTNMSWGVFVFNRLVKAAARELYPDFDIEITERHHNQKIDAPSGTALTLLKNIQSVLPQTAPVYDRHSQSKKREKSEIGMLSARGGTIAGDHEVLFAGLDEIIEIRHSAQSKEIFASGALKAAAFIVTQATGFYGMEELAAQISK